MSIIFENFEKTISLGAWKPAHFIIYQNSRFNCACQVTLWALCLGSSKRKRPIFSKNLLKNNFWFIYLLDHRYCIEIIPHSNEDDAISILKNDEVVDTTPRLKDFNETHRTCFDLFFPSHDMIELRNGGESGVQISLNIINNEISTPLFFGQNADLTSVLIDRNNNECSEKNEITSAITIHDGRIIKSECKG